LSITREIPPTAGWAIKTKDLLACLFNKHPEGLLEEDFKKFIGSPSALLTYSGTAAFYIILKSISKLSPKKTVVIPAFICPLVPLAIERAGLKVKTCDINPYNFDYNPAELGNICSQDKDILAVLAVHLAGIPLEIEKIRNATEGKNIFIIEDCAQSLGAKYRGEQTGRFGDFAFFSLCRGKGLTIYEGGIALGKESKDARLLKETAEEIMHREPVSEFLKIAELFAYSIFYRPSLFWFAFRMPQAFWQLRKNPVRAMGEYFDTGFPVHRISAFRAYFGHSAFPRLDEEINRQIEKAEFYIKGLEDTPGIKPITGSSSKEASYPYLTIIFDSPQKRNLALKEFSATGLGVSQVYLKAIQDYAYLKGVIPENECPGARLIAERTITLSTSCFLKEKDLLEITRRLKEIGTNDNLFVERR